MIDLITTFNKDLFNEYSKNLLDTFLKKSVKICVLISSMKDIEEIKNIYLSDSKKSDFMSLFHQNGIY